MTDYSRFTNRFEVLQATGASYTVSEEEVEEGEIDKLVSAIRSEVDQVILQNLQINQQLLHKPCTVNSW